MPAKPVEITFVAEVASYLRNVKKVEVSTDDIADALVAVSKDSKSLEKDLARSMRDAAKEPKRLERVVKELGREIDDAGDTAKKAGRKMERAFEDAEDAAADAGREVGDEFRQNLGEGLASGNIEDTLTDTIGGLISSMRGPIAGVTTVLGTAVLGAWTLIRKKAEEEQARQEEAYGRWVDRIIEARGRLSEALSEAAIEDATKQFMAESPEEFNELVDAAQRLKVNSDLVLRARVGDIDAINELNGLLNDQLGEQDAIRAMSGETLDAWNTLGGMLPGVEQQFGDIAEYASNVAQADYDKMRGAFVDAARAARDMKLDMDSVHDRIGSIGMKDINVKLRVTPADTYSAIWENRLL